MNASKVSIDRNSSGVYATANVIVKGKTERITIWSAVGHYANTYRNKSDTELKKIAAEHYNATTK